MLNGGGAGDYSSFELGHSVIAENDVNESRLLFNLSFYFVILVLLLNIIVGIIIDTFGSLRDEDDQRQILQRSSCFICGIKRGDFDSMYAFRYGMSGFAHHYKHEHNQWDYMYYTMYVRERKSRDMNSCEKYVLARIEEKNDTWLPSNKALGLEDDSEEQRLYESQESQNWMQRDLATLKGEMKLQSHKTNREMQLLSAKLDGLMRAFESGRSIQPGQPAAQAYPEASNEADNNVKYAAAHVMDSAQNK